MPVLGSGWRIGLVEPDSLFADLEVRIWRAPEGILEERDMTRRDI
jgi:hypothetical protein